MSSEAFWRAAENREEEAQNPNCRMADHADRRLERSRERGVDVKLDIFRRRWLD